MLNRLIVFAGVALFLCACSASGNVQSQIPAGPANNADIPFVGGGGLIIKNSTDSAMSLNPGSSAVCMLHALVATSIPVGSSRQFYFTTGGGGHCSDKWSNSYFTIDLSVGTLRAFGAWSARTNPAEANGQWGSSLDFSHERNLSTSGVCARPDVFKFPVPLGRHSGIGDTVEFYKC